MGGAGGQEIVNGLCNGQTDRKRMRGAGGKEIAEELSMPHAQGG